MIIEEFTKWQVIEPENAQFMRFAESYMKGFPTMSDFLKEILHQIYVGQCCLEGLIEDMEFSDEKKPQKKSTNRKSKKGNG